MPVPYTFANQTGPIPLNELDANFAAIPNYANTAGTVTESVQANITAVGTLSSLSVSSGVTSNTVTTTLVTSTDATITGTTTSGSISTGAVSATSVGISGALTVGNITASGNIIGSKNLTIANISASGTVTATSNVAGGNLTTAGQVVATGNITGGNISVGNNVTISGNLLVSGNATISGTTTTINTQTLNITDKDVVVANNVSTSALIDGAGIIAGNPAVSSLVYSHANLGWGTANNFSVGGNLNVTGAAFATTAANGTSNTQLATTAFVLNNGLPSGCIVLWSGAVVAIPTGWYLCDGGNSTPDLRDRFIVGAGNVYAVGNVGGSTDAIVVTHSHTASSSVTDPGHTHQVVANPGGSSGAFGGGSSASATTITSTANVTGITVSTTVDSTGSSGTNANLPPYYALCYIMKA